ncbi:MAG: peptidase M14 [Xanthomonadales bacterium]|nr:peptidase M14 [Gammaproteobacteria bacterium]MBT8052882.1 peptidase M14 [Gammaproteobacteria bacterium]NND55657.1 peptidase M14 [Xanthomonadales bacterium]NNK49968.1 peptidase M14 [Xanthomonadales bacterium]
MRYFLGAALLLLTANINARSAQEYLPQNTDPDPAVPTPESVLGWDVGDWHVSHDQLVRYLHALAAASPRVSVKTIGYTYERRPLLQVTITSIENQQKLESLRNDHLQGEGPLVVWLGYSVHGDEASGSNASMLAAYYLAASRSAYVNELLAGSVVLIDPSINPDGVNRFASWVNSNAGKVPVSDPKTRQHVQDWPEGRTNHYWFDLNRDWLPLVHPESRARIVEYHRWLPHVLTDHHEQGRFPGFFFQPGVPSRQNPLTPDENLELTRAMAQFHSKAMDAAGQPHFTEDAYDDFYFGKGSTYPDINGSIGILFEQKSILGQTIDTSNGVETFQMAVANQLRMSLSSLEGAWALRDRLKTYQSEFHDQMLKRAAKRNFDAWIVGDGGDPARARSFLDLLDLHRIEYRSLGEGVRAGSLEFSPGKAWVIPARQKQFGLIEAMMEQRTQFKDNTFYDVSAWTLPLAYNLPFATVGRVPETETATESSQGLPPRADARAWAIPWNQLEAPGLLQKLLTAGARVRAASKPFSSQTTNSLQSFQPGTLIVQAGVQSAEVLKTSVEIMTEAALAGIEIHSIDSSMTLAGPDLGSTHFKLIRPINPLLLGGEGVSPYDAGEQWFLLDQRISVPVTIVSPDRLASMNLWDYSHLLMADGKYESLPESQKSVVVRWVTDGGILVAASRAAGWAESLCFETVPEACLETVPETPSEKPVESRAYSDFPDDRAKQVIGGAIVSSILDLSHPLAFGYNNAELPLMRRGTVELKPSENSYSTPVRYASDPLLAGFIGEDRLAVMKGQPAVIAEKQGEGLVIRFANTPLFRGFWRGTEKLFINALYFGQAIEATQLPAFAPPPEPETPRQQ